MTPERWSAADAALAALLLPPDEALDAALAANVQAGLPAIDVAPLQGAFLHVLALGMGARRILEIGTLGGYSAMWLARALPPDGRLVTLELDPHHAEVARASLAAAGLGAVVDVRVGPAAVTLAQLVEAGEGPFDLVFLDADKEGYPEYLGWALRLTRPGSVIVADNVVREGRVADPDDDDPRVVGVRRYLELVAAEPSLRATVLQTVGVKGYDGLAVAVVVPAD